MGAAPTAIPSPPEIPPWQAFGAGRVVVYAIPGTVPDPAAAAARLDALLEAMARDSGLRLPRLLVYPLHASPERFERDWWRFADLGSSGLHGWGTASVGETVPISPYQAGRILAVHGAGSQLPLFAWGLGDLLADRQIGADSHAHARLFLERGGLPPIAEIVHQLDFSRALPAAYPQSISFLAFLAELRGMAVVAALPRAVGGRWYDFPAAFAQVVGLTVEEADRRWRERLARTPAPALSDGEFVSYRRALEVAYTLTLARGPAGLLMRRGGAQAYLHGLETVEAVRRLDVGRAARLAAAATAAGEAARRRAAWGRLGVQVAIWALALIPIVMAVALLAAPALREAWHARRAAARRRRSRRV